MELIKGYTLDKVKIKFIILYILNVTDIIFTLILMNTGFFSEANYVMKSIVDNPLTSLLLKIILPGILLIYIYLRMKNATNEQLKKAKWLVNGIVIFYIIINIMHLIYFALVPMFMKV